MQRIEDYEMCLDTIMNGSDKIYALKVVKDFIALYNKAIEYYSAKNDDRHLEYLQKL